MTVVQGSDYPNGHLLVDVEWVDEHRFSPNVILLDARSEGYQAGHIPGAVPLHVKDVKDTSNHTFVRSDRLQHVLEAAGLNNDTTIIVYDEGGGVLAARLFYVLEYLGLKDQVKLLNGGYTAWASAAKEISTESPDVPAGSITISADSLRVVTKEDIQKGLVNSVLLDVRSAEEYAGLDKRNNRKGGHIKGAIHKEWKEALDPPDEAGVIRFKPYAALKREFEVLGLRTDQTIVPYCQSNQRGAHSYFVLRLLGYSDIRPYEGSWDEWGNDEHTEVFV
ncbi:sulfurtransferase [Paenibacillus sp. SI8]|uniref:sulfurtransferase n=1 Tax=unclassified Paenibacillus TaxID=185978 RepID=UPI003467DE3D